MSILFEKMTAIADNIRSLLGLTEKLGLDAMTENLETANTEVESQTEIIEQLRAVISEKAGKPLGGSIDDLIDGSITEVTSNVESIMKYCFQDRKSLKSATFPNVISIGAYAFSTCSELETIDFPKAETLGGANVFSACSKLKNVNLPKLKALGENTFSTCSSLEKVVFPSVETTHTSGLTGCSKLVQADFPKLRLITSNYLFNKCYSLKVVILRTETICELSTGNAFSNCYHFLGTVNSTYNPNGDKDGYIYVPRALLSDDDATKDYRRATNWTVYASQFRALEDYTVDGTTTGELDESKI